MASRNEHKRVKHKQAPGDISKENKIRMREKKTPIKIFEWHTISDDAAKVYRKMLQDKSKAVQRRRDKRRIQEELDNGQAS